MKEYPHVQWLFDIHPWETQPWTKNDFEKQKKQCISGIIQILQQIGVFFLKFYIDIVL